MSAGRLRPLVVRALTAAAVVALVGASWLHGQEASSAGAPIPHVDDFRHDGNVGEWRARPIDRILPSIGSIPQALLWVGHVADGFVIAAEIRSGVEPDETTTLRMGMRGTGEIELPPIGWGHQFGFVTLEDVAGCSDREFGADDPADCQDWYERQNQYRGALPPLFEREWRVRLSSPEEVEETRATAAFDALPSPVQDAVAPLAARGRPVAITRPIAGTQGGMGVEILIPWSAFPPVRAPVFEDVHLEFEWLSGSPVADWLADAPARPLQRPIDHAITPCRYGLAGILIPGGDGRLGRPASEGAVAYMIPEGSGDLRSLIVLDNEAEGYLYDPTAETWSPAAFEPTFDVLDVGRGERICAPILAFARGDERASPENWTSTGEGDWFGLQVDPRGLEVRRLDNGDLLVKDGARVVWSYYGSGQCGGCPRVMIDFYHVSQRTGRISSAMNFVAVAEPTVRDVEIEVSDDWKIVRVWYSEPGARGDGLDTVWRLTQYCIDDASRGDAFEVCAEQPDVQEPADRLRRLYTEDIPFRR